MGKTAGKKSSKPVVALPSSPFVRLVASFQLPLSPCAYHHPIEGICAEHISPHLLSYWDKLHGVLLSYSNPRISETPDQSISSSHKQEPVLARSIAEYGVSYTWFTAEFLIFRPERGTTLKGDVNLHSESVLGFMCYNYFNAVIEREKLPVDWSWDGEQWVDGQGKIVQGSMKFQVDDFEANGQDSISIMGSMRAG